MLGIGWAGVQLFFVLSGFLITSILLKEKEAPLGYYLKRFYWRRTLRIFPLYYLYIVLAGLSFVATGLPGEYFQYLPFLGTYTFNFYPLVKSYSYEDAFFMHFWSLSVEEQFYLIWPLVIFFCNRKTLGVILLLILVGAPLTRLVLADAMMARNYLPHYVGETVYRFTLGQWDGFAFGAMIPVFSLGSRNLPAGKLLIATTTLFVILGFWNFQSLAQQGLDIHLSSLGYQIGEMVNYQHAWSYTLLDFIFFLLILFVTYPPEASKNAVDKVFGNSVLVYFGKISYGLYVYHWIITMAFNKYLKNWFPSPWLGLLAYVGTSMAVATASYFIYELPILSLKNRLFPPLNHLNRSHVQD